MIHHADRPLAGTVHHARTPGPRDCAPTWRRSDGASSATTGSLPTGWPHSPTPNCPHRLQQRCPDSYLCGGVWPRADIFLRRKSGFATGFSGPADRLTRASLSAVINGRADAYETQAEPQIRAFARRRPRPGRGIGGQGRAGAAGGTSRGCLARLRQRRLRMTCLPCSPGRGP